MKKQYLFIVFLVASTFAYYEFYKPQAIKKPLKSSKKLEIIEFKRPVYDFTSVTKKSTPKKILRKKSIVSVAPFFIEEKTIIQTPTIQTIEPKKSIDVSDEQIVKNLVPQNIVSATVGDDVEGQLNEIKNMRQALLKSHKTPQFLKDSIMALESLREDYGLDVGFAYRSVVQSDFVTNELGGGGNLDILAMYKPNKNSTFAINLNAAHKVGQYTSSGFANEIGSLYTTSPSYSNKDAQVSEFWYQFRRDELSLRFGIVDASSYLDSSFFMSSNNFFFNSSISSTPYAKVPDNGLGISMNYKTDKFYLSAHLSDANAKAGTFISSSVDGMINDSISLYSALEVGMTYKESLYYMTLWHNDKEKDSKGVIFSLNQTLDETHKVFIKVALSSKASAKKYISVGWGRSSLFHKYDRLGVAYSASKSQKTGDFQNNFEMFYRYDYLYGIQLSASIELLNPIYSDENLAILGGLRLRLVF